MMIGETPHLFHLRVMQALYTPAIFMRFIRVSYSAISAETTLSAHSSKCSGVNSYSSPAQSVADAGICAALRPRAGG